MLLGSFPNNENLQLFTALVQFRKFIAFYVHAEVFAFCKNRSNNVYKIEQTFLLENGILIFI